MPAGSGRPRAVRGGVPLPEATTNGIRTYYEVEGQGPAVVLIHGHGANLRLWDGQVGPLVEQGHRVIRYDVRGHGRSEAPEGGYAWPSYAADLRDLLDHLGEGRAHLVGISMGGGIALQFALDYPERTASLVLMDSTLPGYTYSEEMSGAVERLQEAIRRDGPHPTFERIWLEHPIFEGVRRFPEKLALVEAMARAYSAREYLLDLEPPAGPQISDRLGEVRAPTLVLVGELDTPDFQAIAVILAENIRNANYLVVEDAGHLVNLEQPDQVNNALADFFHNVMTGLIDPTR